MRRSAVVSSPRDNPSSPAERLDAVVARLADRIGELIAFWGFSPHTGRVWTLLYLSSEPLSAAEIGRLLSMSTGLVSQTLAELLRWGVIHRVRQPSSKAWLYAEDPDIWRGVTRVLREREHRMVTDTIALIDSLLEVVRGEGRGAAGDRARHIAARLTALRRLARAAQIFLDALLVAARLDVRSLKEVMRLADIRRKIPLLG